MPGIGLRKRIIFLFISTTLALLGLMARVGYLQFWRGAELQAQAFENRLRNITVEPKRGLIIDANGNELALSVSADSVFAVSADVKDPAAVAQRLSEILDLSYVDAYERITRPAAWWYVKRKITDEQSQRIKEEQKDLPGIYLTQESRRIYPKGTLAAHILGFAGIDNQGLEGIEHYYDSQLRGQNGRIEIEFDARGREIPQAVQHFEPAEDGLTLRLTVDENIQHVVERELDRAMLAHGAKGAVGIVYEPCTGRILAMSSRPTFDPNRFGEFPPQQWRNAAVSDTLPPGSTFKPIVAAAALEEGIVAPATPFYDPGFYRVPGATIHNWNRAGLGSTDFATGFEKSANTIFARVAVDLGSDRFYHYLDAFGLTRRTGIDLPGEAVGIRPPKDQARTVDLAVMGFGQTLTVTPIQLVAALGAIACEGTLMRPHIAAEWLDAEGNVIRVQEPEAVRQVVSAQVARTVLGLMERVVTSPGGTGGSAKVEGYRVGGKTGTSQKYEGGRIAQGKYIASFAGIAPISDPRMVVYVAVDEPQGIYFGGWVAAPVAGAIMRDVLHYLQIPPDQPDQEGPPPITGRREPTVVPNLVNLTLAEAEAVARYAGLTLRVQGSGTQVSGQFPVAGARVAVGTQVVVSTEASAVQEEEWTVVTVPELAGSTRQQAAERLAAVGLHLEAIGQGVAAEQDPAPGTKVPSGSYVKVVFHEEQGEDEEPGEEAFGQDMQ